MCHRYRRIRRRRKALGGGDGIWAGPAGIVGTEPFPGKEKGLPDRSESPTCGEYEIRTREAVTPTRFPSVRHRPLGEFSNYSTLLGVYP